MKKTIVSLTLLLSCLVCVPVASAQESVPAAAHNCPVEFLVKIERLEQENARLRAYLTQAIEIIEQLQRQFKEYVMTHPEV